MNNKTCPSFLSPSQNKKNFKQSRSDKRQFKETMKPRTYIKSKQIKNTLWLKKNNLESKFGLTMAT